MENYKSIEEFVQNAKSLGHTGSKEIFSLYQRSITSPLPIALIKDDKGVDVPITFRDKVHLTSTLKTIFGSEGLSSKLAIQLFEQHGHSLPIQKK